MNLSDLVHRTAGENKTVIPSRLNTNDNTSNNSTSALFSHLDPSSPSNVLSSFSRQDTPSFLFSMTNTDWMNNSVFFNSINGTEIEPLPQEANPIFVQQKPQTPNKSAFHTFNLSPTKSFDRQEMIVIPHTTTKTTTTTTMDHTVAVTLTEPSIQPTENVSPIVTTSPSLANEHQSLSMIKGNHRLSVNGDNVTANNIAEGYIQFVLCHDESYIGDGIESLVYAKRKFYSVPKTADISYSTWDIYQLVLKLHKREIKNWSQLVGQLGLQDMTGRPQFAQRVKRWMHRYKIDCYFDYLLGNDYEFHSPSGKYSGCLTMGNYKKRDNPHPDQTTKSDEEDVEETNIDQQRIPILLAGSRKRMRDYSQNSIQMIENAQKYLRLHQSESDHDEEDEDMSIMNTHDQDVVIDQQKLNSFGKTSTEHNSEDDKEMEEEEEGFGEEEEDELASSSSSPSSPIRIVIPSPKITQKPSPAKPISHSTPELSSHLYKPSLLPSLPPLSACSNCKSQENKVAMLEKEISSLKSLVFELETKSKKQSVQINKLLRQRDRTERWRKQVIADLARGPLISSDDDDDDEEEEEEEDEEEEERSALIP
ncbi:ARS binding protein 2-domain-containing protein [Choanephora cucurbitarum]|nr:ARS binding protein 2-domain-containing protein [Choanephora cucurbitarum]